MSPALPAATLPSAEIQIQVDIIPLQEETHLASIWSNLEARADRSFFLSWTWISSWLQTIDCRPELIMARRCGEIVGLGLVHARLKTRHRLLPIWTVYLHQTGDDDQDVITIEYNDILADRRYRDDIRNACLRFLLDHGECCGQEAAEVLLGGIDAALKSSVKGLGRPVYERATAGSAFVDLKAKRSDGVPFLETLKTTTARRIRRSMALYRERGPLELKVAADLNEALEFFDRCGELHQTRWTARGRPGAFAYPFYVAFHRRLIKTALPLGQVELARISVAGEPIGYLYNFLDHRRVYYYFSGFRFEDDNRLKPGLVCHTLCIERHLARNMDVYDFMAGDQRYKLELGQPGPEIVSLAVQRPNWMLAAERPLRRLKQVLGEVRQRG